jgi:hypothetical protein
MSYEKETAVEPDKIAPDPSFAPDSHSLSAELDDNYALYKQNQEAEIDPAEAKKVLRKIDKRIVPILILIYLLQYLDKNGINYASVYGLEEGTKLQGQDYSWLGSIFYFGELHRKWIRINLTWIQDT